MSHPLFKSERRPMATSSSRCSTGSRTHCRKYCLSLPPVHYPERRRPGVGRGRGLPRSILQWVAHGTCWERSRKSARSRPRTSNFCSSFVIRKARVFCARCAWVPASFSLVLVPAALLLSCPCLTTPSCAFPSDSLLACLCASLTASGDPGTRAMLPLALLPLELLLVGLVVAESNVRFSHLSASPCEETS